jgi:hypothetical protein
MIVVWYKCNDLLPDYRKNKNDKEWIAALDNAPKVFH